MDVKTLMQRNVATVGRGARLDAAAALLRDRDCGCVVVIDDQVRPVGVVTDRDVCIAALQAAAPLADVAVADVMSERPFTCRADDSIEHAEQHMSLHQVRRLPVVDGTGRLVGLLALDDIAREAGRETGLLAPPVSCAAVGRTLGSIVRPRIVDERGVKVRS